MRRIIASVLLLFSAFFAFSQTVSTPNAGLHIPSSGSSNWNLPLNYNFNRIDQILGGSLNIATIGFQLKSVFGAGSPTVPCSPATLGQIYFNTSIIPYPGYGCDGTTWRAIATIGPVGPTGPPNSLSIGTVVSLATGQPATASVSGTAPIQFLSLGLPTGATGNTGATGATGANGATGASGQSLSFAGAWSSVTAYTAGQTVSYGNNAWIALQASTNVTPVSGTYWVPVGTTPVACLGTNDLAAIQTALNGAGHVVLTGTCVMSGATSTLIVKPNTWLDAYGATINFSPSTWMPILQNQNLYIATGSRAFSDAVVTSGSTTVTSATAVFTSADVGRYINCAGGIVTATLSGYPSASSSGLITYIATVTNGTTIVLADSPNASINPTGCTIFGIPDNNIKISGGTWNIGGAGVSGTTNQEFMLDGVTNLTLQDLTMADGFGGNAGSGSKFIHIGTASRFLVKNLKLNSSSLLQDGVDLYGPLTVGVIDGVDGCTGDDLIAVSSVSFIGGWAPVKNIQINNTQSCGYNGIKLFGNNGGTKIPLTDITINNFKSYGTWHCIRLASGKMNNIVVNGAGGACQAETVEVMGGTIGNLTLRDLSNSYPLVGAIILNIDAVSNVVGDTTINNLIVDGIQVDSTAVTSPLPVNLTAASASVYPIIHNFSLNNVNVLNSLGNPIMQIGETHGPIQIDDLSVSNVKATYNVAYWALLNIGGLTNKRLSLNGIHVTETVGTGSTCCSIVAAAAAGGYATAIGDVFMNDIWSSNAVPMTFSNLYYQTNGTLNSYNIANVHLNNMVSCATLGITPTSASNFLTNVSATNLTGNCAAPYMGSPQLVGTLSRTELSATTGFYGVYTVPAGVTNGLYQESCQLSTASVTGTGTASVAASTNSPSHVYATSAVMTMSAGATTQVIGFMQLNAGQVISHSVVITAGGGTYNEVCTVLRMQ
jgi:hypothetical protein